MLHNNSVIVTHIIHNELSDSAFVQTYEYYTLLQNVYKCRDGNFRHRFSLQAKIHKECPLRLFAGETGTRQNLLGTARLKDLITVSG